MSVRHALLALLTEGPKFGFRLREEFEQRTGDVWPLNVGQVYTTLQRLERDGLVESASEEGDSPQKDYAITDEGLREVHEWLRTPPAAIPPRDDLVIKVLVAVGMPGVDLPEVLQSHRRRLVELMQTYTRLKEDTPDDVRVALVVDAEIFRLDALIRWVDSAHARVNAMPPAAVSEPATGKATTGTVAVER